MEEDKKEEGLSQDSEISEKRNLDLVKVGERFVSKEARSEFLKIFIEFARVSLAMIVALSWNEAIPALVHQALPGMGGGATVGLFAYAIAITVMAIVVISILGKFKSKDENIAKKKT